MHLFSEAMPILCDKCGAENRDYSQFCQRCGAKLSGKDGNVAADSRMGFLGTRKFAAIVIIIAVAAIVLLLPFFPIGAGIGIPASASHTSTIQPTVTTTIVPASVTPTTYNPTYGLTFYGNVEYNRSTVIWGDVAATGNITIDKGVVVTTNGSSFLAGGTFRNLGVIDTGNTSAQAALGAKGRSYPNSYGGSGGSGGGGGGHSSSGGSANAPGLSALVIQGWYANGTANYLTGAGGGGGCRNKGYAGNGGNTHAQGGLYQDQGVACTGVGGSGGAGARGIYIQANTLIAGIINANGQSGAAGTTNAGGSGGGGVILLTYGVGGYTPGAYNVNGGGATMDGGAGGSGQVLNYSYGSGPAPVYIHATPASASSGVPGTLPFPTIKLLLAPGDGNQTATQFGSAVWTLQNSMRAKVLPIAFITYKPGITVTFESSTSSGSFVSTTGQLYANQCTTGYDESCIVAYTLPGSAANFTITAHASGTVASANIQLD